MLSFQNLQNLASLQQQKLGFVGLAGLTSPTTCLNSPLNLSLSSSSHADPNQMNANCSTSIASELAKNLCAASGDNFSPQMPQLILASVRQSDHISYGSFEGTICFCQKAYFVPGNFFLIWTFVCILGRSINARGSSCTASDTITSR